LQKWLIARKSAKNRWIWASLRSSVFPLVIWFEQGKFEPADKKHKPFTSNSLGFFVFSIFSYIHLGEREKWIFNLLSPCKFKKTKL